MIADSELARRTPTGIQIRPSALRLKWELAELTTSDGHIARGTFTASARVLPDPNELKMLDESLLGSRAALTAGDVTSYFAEPLLSAARKHAATTNAQNLLADDGRRAALAALMDAAGTIAFTCGLEILQPAQLDLDCPTLARQRYEEIERQTSQRRAAEQVDRLRRSAELFTQFQSLRATAPTLSAGQVLTQLSPEDQADAFRAAIQSAASGAAATPLYVVAGNSLIKIPREENSTLQSIETPADLGPIRSIRAGSDGMILLGCRGGILHLDPASPHSATRYCDLESTSQLGFNAAVIIGSTFWASHGEAGLVAWNIDEPDKPTLTIRPATSKIPAFSPRNLARLDANRLVLSSGSQLILCTQSGELTPVETHSEIIGVFPQPGRILTVHADGNICAWSTTDLQPKCKQRRAGRICAAALFPFLDDYRILLATEDGPILCVGPDDDVITQYATPYPAPRILAAAPDLIAAVTSDRQRLILWHTWDPKKPYRDHYLYNISKHRIADIALV
jgi:hypothetical protein